MQTAERPRRLPKPNNLHQDGLLLDLSVQGTDCEVAPPPYTADTLCEICKQLLVQCAAAVEANDASSAEQLLWVLTNIAHGSVDHGRRLAAGFLRALVERAVATGCFKGAQLGNDFAMSCHRFSAVDLAKFIDLTPWYRFGYTAANAAIAEATDGFPAVHVVDLTTTHCMQIPTLIDLLASRRPDSPPFLRLTVPISTISDTTPPLITTSYDELGSKLVAFASSRNMRMEFIAVPSNPSNAFNSLLDHVRLCRAIAPHEALIINCQMLLHRIPDILVRDFFLQALRSLEPTLLTLVDEDVDLVHADLIGRIRSAYNYFWIPLDASDICLSRSGSEWKQWHEEEVTWKIENLMVAEGIERVERQERRGRWARRMAAAGFRSVGLGEEAEGEAREVLGAHAAAWGMRREEEEDVEEALVLTWKGHEVVFATAWVPC